MRPSTPFGSLKRVSQAPCGRYDIVISSSRQICEKVVLGLGFGKKSSNEPEREQAGSMRWSCTVTSRRVKWKAGKRTIGVSPPSWRGFEALAPALGTSPARATADATTPNTVQPRISVNRADDGDHPNVTPAAVPGPPGGNRFGLTALKRSLRVLATSGNVGVHPFADEGVTRSLRRESPKQGLPRRCSALMAASTSRVRGRCRFRRPDCHGRGSRLGPGLG